MTLKKHLKFLGDCPADQIACPAAQKIGERINDFLFPAKPNYRTLVHGGVTPLMVAEIDFDNRIPAGHAAFFNSYPYTRFGYSSVCAPLALCHDPIFGQRPIEFILLINNAAPLELINCM
jgi:hypothetical protein